MPIVTINNAIKSAPTFSGEINISSRFRILNTGLTNTLLLIGHADADVMYEPYEVLDMQNAIDFLGGSITSPLVKALLEAYNGGCRDIWLYPAAPMDEYVDEAHLADRLISKEEFGNKTFYELYYERLVEAYDTLLLFDFPEIIVAPDAPFWDTGDVDFYQLLSDFCIDLFESTGQVAIGVMGTKAVDYGSSSIQNLLDDDRIVSFGDIGKFVSIFVGEAVISHPQTALTYKTAVDVQMATLLSVTSLGRSVTGITLPGAVRLTNRNLTKAEIEALSVKSINAVTYTQLGKRNRAFQIKALTDHTTCSDDQGYWPLTIMRLISFIANQIRFYGREMIGGPNIQTFITTTQSFLDEMESNGYFRDYSVVFTPDTATNLVTVDLDITPVLDIRHIQFSVNAGPGA